MQSRFRIGFCAFLSIAIPLCGPGIVDASDPVSTAKSALFDHDNLVAWCIVPFDSKKRGPEERATMLEKLGLKQLAYDYRAEHIPTFDAEMDALKRHGIRLTAWWFPGELNDEARNILDVLKRHKIQTQLWVTGSGGPTASEEDRQQRVEDEANRIRPIAEAAAQIGCQVALYNHGGWFGEPENQIAIIQQLDLPNVGIVYNLHHGHEHLDRFPKLLQKMKPYLLTLNLNGMTLRGDQTGKKILPLGAGDLDAKLLQTIRDSGWRGPIGILNHTDHDAEARLQDNLDGLDWLVGHLDSGNAGTRPKYRTYEPPKPNRALAFRGGIVVKGKAEPDDATLGLWKFNHLDDLHFEDQVGEIQGRPLLPFPRSRVRDFYLEQARHQLDSGKPPPQYYPEHPGLDGGAFGHWGNNPESDNTDNTLGDVDIGDVFTQVAHHFGTTTPKAVTVRIGNNARYTALFDPKRLTFTDVWEGGVTFGDFRFGLFSGIQPAGKRVLDLAASHWSLHEGTTTRYVGLYRNGKRVVFVYQIGDATIYDHVWTNNGEVTRSMSVEGALPDGAKLDCPLAPTFDHGQTRALAAAGPAQWADRQVTTSGTLGTGDGPYVIDTITIPYRNQNPFKTPMHLAGLDFLPDGRAAVSTFLGDVWLVDGMDGDLDQIRWTRFAAGLNQPLGLVVQDGKILVAGRDQITRLHDRNGDDEADFYECVSNQFATGVGHDFLTNLLADNQGRLYFFSPGTGAARLNPHDGQIETLGSGLRNSNGMGVSADGQIVLVTPQEGPWTPATGIFEVHDGSYHGYPGPRQDAGKYGYQMPLCFIPRGVDHSSGGLEFVPQDARWGPLAGNILGTSFGNCSHYLVLRETIGDNVQGGVIPLPGEFLSGAHRLKFNARDGQLYVVGTDGWVTYAQEDGSFQRLRYVGGEMPLPTAIESHENGLLVRFNCEVDPHSVDTRNIFCQQWNYLYSKAYGSAEFSARNPVWRGHDPVPVRAVHLLDDGRSVFVEIPHLHPVMQFHLHMRLATQDGQPFSPDVYYSLFHLRKPFTNFPEYAPITRKDHYPDFPIAQEYPPDERLVAQEALGMTPKGLSLEVTAEPGLRYQPRRLRVPPGKRVALTVKNTDISMPHNLVLVTPDRLDPIGEGAMLMAADPRAIASHYVPDDPGILGFSPTLWPGEQYTIYFDSPREKGAYPFACSFPGHWRVMRGVLYVVDEGEPLPPESELDAPQRAFVKQWKTEDLSADVARLKNRSYNRGLEMFHVANCVKCHKINCQGSQLGPDLTEVRKRFVGAKLLQQILQPSSEINKKYQTYVVSTDAGKMITGLLVQEDAESLHLVSNPLQPEQVTIVPKDEIEETIVSTQSTMPEGLLMTLSRDEILDLLAFIEAGGNGTHDYFQR